MKITLRELKRIILETAQSELYDLDNEIRAVRREMFNGGRRKELELSDKLNSLSAKRGVLLRQVEQEQALASKSQRDNNAIMGGGPELNDLDNEIRALRREMFNGGRRKELELSDKLDNLMMKRGNLLKKLGLYNN